MADFEKELRKISEGLRDLKGDIEKIVADKKKPQDVETGEDKKKNISKGFKDLSLKSLQPTTKLYKDKNEIKQAKDNPEVEFISKQLDKIFE